MCTPADEAGASGGCPDPLTWSINLSPLTQEVLAFVDVNSGGEEAGQSRHQEVAASRSSSFVLMQLFKLSSQIVSSSKDACFVSAVETLQQIR